MRIVTTTNLLTKYNKTASDIQTLTQSLNAQLDILPINSSAISIKAHIDAVDDSILLLGGHSIIPFWTLPNPSNDADETLLSDAPYASTTDPLYYVPTKSVGRIPDEEGNNPQFDYLQTVIEHQGNYLKNKSNNNGWVNMVASVWQGISSYMSSQFNMNTQTLIPPVIFTNLNSTIIDGKKYAYLNTHGAKSSPSFYGQSGYTYPVALNPTPGFFNGTIVFAEACYGGYIIGRDRTTSIPLQALLSGALGFVGGTGVQYGPAMPPADGIDLLSYLFFKEILNGNNLGKSFMNAKINFFTQLIKNTGNAEPSNKKTILQTNLFGLPDIIV